jgi:hypothetical protein
MYHSLAMPEQWGSMAGLVVQGVTHPYAVRDLLSVLRGRHDIWNARVAAVSLHPLSYGFLSISKYRKH